MTPLQLADKIRDRVDLTFSEKVSPQQRHLHAAAVQVAAALGMKPDFHNLQHLTGLLAVVDTE